MSKKRKSKRSSVKYAEWQFKREDWYRKECEEILYRQGKSISIVNDIVYVHSENSKTFLRKIDGVKSTWYQIWLKLADR